MTEYRPTWGHWGTVDASDRLWSVGWALDARCPPDPKHSATPGGGGWQKDWHGEKWETLHEARRRIVRVARQAGYVARHWARHSEGVKRVGRGAKEQFKYDEGPAAGRTAVDPWDVAKRLGNCGASWSAVPVIKGGAGVIGAVPQLCGCRLVCPVCAHRWALQRVSGLEARIGDSKGSAVLVTLTQRSEHGETLASALDRWRKAWRSLQTGRAGAFWRASVGAYQLGIEVGEAALREGRWHVHGHVVVMLTGDPEAFKTWIATTWDRVTDAAKPGSGCQPASRADGGWWRPITDRRGLIQACKYPAVVTSMGPRLLAEWVATSYRRRWVELGGSWRGAVAEAADRGIQGVPHLSPDAVELVDDSRNGAVAFPLRNGAPLGCLALLVGRMGGRGEARTTDGLEWIERPELVLPVQAARHSLKEWSVHNEEATTGQADQGGEEGQAATPPGLDGQRPDS